ncbi:hypothetical protein CGMCC3_g10984 [Colletotrichum fructicola]|nr:uncharacterized protein CGMCC3_g10984 [Colletotrichum fructicola]KAE9572870.1 hypothetical protein CGMCC3_g10984 [Colletotrichum fructicola]
MCIITSDKGKGPEVSFLSHKSVISLLAAAT